MPEPATGLDVRPLTPERWPDLEALFGARGCSVARCCWCMYYRRSGRGEALPAGRERVDANRRALKALVDARGCPPGLVGYRGSVPVGWVSLGPREDYRKLARSPLLKPVDELPAWAIVCFVVPSEHRGQGVAEALLDAAIAHARAQGASRLEAYPVDLSVRPDAASLWFGVLSMYERAGFREVARRRPDRPIVRLELAAPSSRRARGTRARS